MTYSSSIFCRDQHIVEKQLPFVFEISYLGSEMGFTSVIIQKKTVKFEELHQSPFKHNPELLQKIYFRYYSSSSGVINWCNRIHEMNTRPNVVLISSLEDFCDPLTVEAVEFCAALIDATSYCKTITKKQKSFLVIQTVLDISTYHPYLLTLFDQVFSINSTPEDLVLYEVFPKSLKGESIKLSDNAFNSPFDECLRHCLVNKLFKENG